MGAAIKKTFGGYAVSLVDGTEYGEAARVWESSVRASHTFLKESDILSYKKLILEVWLNAVDLFAVRDGFRKILGFMGVSGEKIEMLFVLPEMRGKGIGRTLVDYAVRELSVKKVDVNEQNVAAAEFYYKNGFAVEGRSEKDAAGKPYPVLHLGLFDKGRE
ncbi:MAG: GNAT family N-acetyltransferase [Clostridiales bacterium]|jgi:putative acetyltransferase|nr:GNAT family N-acetyltransferase [Clostridiales bacterium]